MANDEQLSAAVLLTTFYPVVPVVLNFNHDCQIVMHELRMMDVGEMSGEDSKSRLHVGAF